MIQETFDHSLIGRLNGNVAHRDSLLDVGSGPCVLLRYLDYKLIVALDIHRPYLISRQSVMDHIIPINADATMISQLFIPQSFSTVSFIDSLEHFTKEQGLQLLRDAEMIAKHHVVVFTPRGYFPQQNVDHYGMMGEKFQEHHSGWEAEELEELGYAVTIMKGFHDHENAAFVSAYGVQHEPIDALFAIKSKSF
ncbi:class I SAM-dependent methyltransferase [Paenibacillus oenotherae]|uniref:Class I SAM-dependent methyltransferase n=1 Tax=Paenibacillus oenotherae TaxID=1435645 RepID=A0ABS7DB24_9BACL|nr:class I SAM-dependent methyltransferase [Paenibacillus oenotherae]MBW7477134.1 class I SAM-dependent methyltransferase [Paenibacillus oenotherae]